MTLPSSAAPADLKAPRRAVVRYQGDSDPEPLVGVLEAGQLHPMKGIRSIADLLSRTGDEIARLIEAAAESGSVDGDPVLLPPLDGRGELWCSGVTYQRSKDGRMEESAEATVYDKVYAAERPELFAKSPAWRLIADGEPVGIRSDSGHDVPEPELALVCNAFGEIVGYAVCNDMSSRSIEGENPVYIPQAKVFAGGCSVSSGFVPAADVADPSNLRIRMRVVREGQEVFADETSTAQLARPLAELVRYLFHPLDFPDGVMLATGTGIVPELDFALADGDLIEIEIDQVGRLRNTVRVGKEPFRALSHGNRPSHAGIAARS
ncbi:fumarylacetoacetate hydrolase family protein [Sinomonas humi]|uniref:fumarylacetoacetate hydrolase family protein n=1 Tax=Sinomonas humi TaxID=1338436 RepID=UPI000689C623|nr:fumarylacetoacetate hydrolase family protein [Sinomonas humi]